ncbi:unnamed protein product, partial [Heterosigma akashiwo]
GGQKQRVALARALYGRPDVLLLDDALSAVDAAVGAHLFHRAVLGTKGATRVLVTHQVGLTLPHADRVLVLGADGRAAACGTPRELMAALGAGAGGGAAPADALVEHLVGLASEVRGQGDGERQEDELRQAEFPSPGAGRGSKDGSGKSAPAEAEGVKDAKGKLVKEEKSGLRRTTPILSFLVYLKACGGYPFVLAFISLSVSWQVMFFSQPFFFSNWISHMEMGTNQRNAFHIYMYACAATVAAVILRSLAAAAGSLHASRKTHEQMTRRVLFAPMSWFHATPLGHILNRFSSDMTEIDSVTMNNLVSFMDALLGILGVVCSICAALPWMALGLAVITSACAWIGRIFMRAAPQLKRLETTSKSPMYAHFVETLQGAPTIRAFRAQARFVEENARLVDASAQAHYLFWIANYWIAYRLRILGAGVVGLGGLCIVLYAGRMSGSTAGLVLSFATQFNANMLFAIRLYSQLQVSLYSMDRAKEYCQIEQEAPVVVEGNRPPEGWPGAGALEVKDLVLRYPGTERPVLRGLSFAVPAGARVGVVGRTGAGKTSLVLALFRLVEPAAGAIWLDGVDTGKLGLHDLRRALAAIPQDPVLFAGTLRTNLDPHGARGDALVWAALDRAGLRGLAARTPGGLGAAVAAGGRGLSAGERQLLCLARALLRDARVLVLDEATASVDPGTDARVQRALRATALGRRATVLCVAHRLHTVADHDLVLVLEQGRVAEYGKPRDLLLRVGSRFRSLCESSGDYDRLLAIANQQNGREEL